MKQGDRTQRADFHTHSTASDGLLAPAVLVQESAQRGLNVVALTDHDTTRGIADAVAAGNQHGVRVLPGIELSAAIRRGELHILGYGIDPNSIELQSQLARMRQERRERAESMVESLAALGIPLPGDVLSGVAEDESIGRPHIARALMDAGVVESVSGGFDRYLGYGRPAYVPKPMISASTAIALIRDAGGVAVMAHPYSAPEFRELLPGFVDAGLAGIECYYGEYSDERRSALAAIAREYRLLATGGSDFHGHGYREGRELGNVDLPQDAIDALLVALG